MRVGVVVFPGSNCDHDTLHAFRTLPGVEVDMLWHKDTELDGCDLVVLPGGFSYGDYLRSGAIARLSPMMQAVERFAADGGHVMGICNGWQILVEAGLLPGALRPNAGLKFRCQDVDVRVERTDTPYTGRCRQGDVLRLHIAHYEGNYFADPETLQQLEDDGRVVLRYCGPNGERQPRYNPNGSAHDIAGICSPNGRVFGLMPHPERCIDARLGSTDGRSILESLLPAPGTTDRPSRDELEVRA